MFARALATLSCAAALCVGAVLIADADEDRLPPYDPAFEADAQIDYDGFADLTDDVEALRETRRVGLERFLAMAAEPNTILLDARSESAFAAGHIAGAVNLPFSDFTDEKLAAVLGGTDTRILIYCNNNFENDVAPIVLKRAPLALNIPTFINLVGYGYENVWELGDVVDAEDPAVRWVSGPN